MSRLMKQASVPVHVRACSDANAKAAACRRIGARWRAGVVVALGVLLAAVTPVAAYKAPDWDQVENIKEAALRLAEMQRRQGATRAFQFIDACYRTHSLSSEYTRAFEACIAQDYLETRILVLIYSRMPPETLKRLGMPTPKILADTMGKRIVTAFKSYDVPVADVLAFKKLVDEHGFPVFFKALFPNSKVPEIKDEPQSGPDPSTDASPKDAPSKDVPTENAPKNGEKQ